ncbi:MAG: metallophosphoesterase, partial [Thiovulaceae bacterium]|nr:metallophosphoesterase [Sulfurimonadaceae bacterium]
RRDFFKKTGDYGVFAFAASYTTTATIENLQDPVLKSVKLDQKLLNIPIKIVQISDLHISRSMDEAFVERIVTRINALEADIIAITGDLVDAKVTDIQAAIDWLGKLKAKQGTFFVTGNHEYYIDTQEILGYLDDMGIQIMDNKNTFIEELGINLVGVPDLHAGQFATQDNDIYAMDILKATLKLKKDTPTLLLAHQPKAIEFLEDFKPHLTLSGHTHGGQLFPFNYLVRLAQPYVKDLHQFDKESFIYVSSGTGFWGPPMRLGVPSEITLIEWS